MALRTCLKIMKNVRCTMGGIKFSKNMTKNSKYHFSTVPQSVSQSPSKASRFINIAGNFTDEPRPAKFFNQMFDARLATTNQINSSLTEQLGEDEEAFVKYWSQIKTYITDIDGLTMYERTSIAAAAIAWYPWYHDQDHDQDHDQETDSKVIKNIHIDLTSEDADEVLSEIKTSWPAMARKAILLSALSTSSVQELNDEEYAEFVGVAQKLDIDKHSVKQMHLVHSLECQLKEEYKALYGIK